MPLLPRGALRPRGRVPGLPPRRPGRRARGAGPRAAAHGPRRRAPRWRTGSGRATVSASSRPWPAAAATRSAGRATAWPRASTRSSGRGSRRSSWPRSASRSRTCRGSAWTRTRRRRSSPSCCAAGSPDPPQDTYRVHFTRGTSPSPTVVREGVRRLPPLPRARRPRRHRERGPQPLRPLHAVLPDDGSGRPRVDRRRPSPTGCATRGRRGRRRRCRPSHSARTTCGRSRPSWAARARRRGPLEARQ